MSRGGSKAKHILRRILDHTTFDESSCWLFIGSLNKKGYGEVRGVWLSGKRELVHRISAHFFLGYEFEDGWQINHKLECKNRNCWNPEHIYIGTQKGNIFDAIATGKYSNQYGPINKGKATSDDR